MGIKNRFMNAGRGYPARKGSEQQVAKSNAYNHNDGAELCSPVLFIFSLLKKQGI